MTNEIPAGWYPAPHAGNNLRYWDGDGWLDIAPPQPPNSHVPAPASAAPITRAVPQGSSQPVNLGASIAPQPKNRRWPLVVIPLVIVALIGAGITNYALNQSESTGTGYVPKPEPPVDARPDIPAGYQDTGVGLGIKFVDKPCSLSMGRCNHLEVYAVDGCPNSVYVEMNILDSAANVIGFTNDTVASLRAGQTAILEFNYFEDEASRVEVVDASCF